MSTTTADQRLAAAASAALLLAAGDGFAIPCAGDQTYTKWRSRRLRDAIDTAHRAGRGLVDLPDPDEIEVLPLQLTQERGTIIVSRVPEDDEAT